MQASADPNLRHSLSRGCARLAGLLLVVGLCGAGPSPAETRGDSSLQIGLRCETRPEFRRVSRYDFVVDRVTECRPLAFGCPASHEASSIPEPPASIEADTPAPDLAESGTESPTRADRLADWAAGRRRLANAQYDRSVHAMAERFRGAAR